MTIGTISQIRIMFVVCKIVKMFSFKNIYICYKECKKNKSNKINTLHFEVDLLSNLWKLYDELNSKQYKIGKSICFLANSPKLREVFAADFKDRIVHHILVKQLEPLYEKKFIFDVYNNRKNKGIHKAIKKAQSYMHRYNNTGYYLQLDIKGFFYNLDKNILFKQLFRDITTSNIDAEVKKKILYISNKIIYHDPTRNYIFKGNKKNLYNLPTHKTLFKIVKNKGLPIGNLTSQFFANIYMNKFDNFIKRELKVNSYIRYVDDFILFDKSKQKLIELKQKIEYYLKQNLDLTLRDDFRIRKFDDGLDFLGYIIRPNYILVRNRVINNYKYKKAKFYSYYENGGDKDLQSILKYNEIRNSFLAHVKHANSYNLIKKIGAI
jgi:RNA-directed DNA polymerase